MAFEDIDGFEDSDDMTDEAQAALFDEAMAREARHDAREPEPPSEDEQGG